MTVVILYPEKTVKQVPITQPDNKSYLESVEWYLFAQDYKNDDIFDRLARIEQKTWGKVNLGYGKYMETIESRTKRIADHYSDVVPRDSSYDKVVSYKTEQSTDPKMLVFKTVTSSQHEWSSRITKNPVEKSTDITDHAINDLPSFSITVFIPASINININEDLIVNEEYKIKSPYAFTATKYDIYNEIIKLRDKKIPFTLVTPVDVFNMILIEKVSLPVEKGDAFLITMSFQKIRVVKEKKSLFSYGGGSSKNLKKYKDKKKVSVKTTPQITKSNYHDYTVDDKTKAVTEQIYNNISKH